MDDITVKTKRVDVLPIVKYYMDQLSLYGIFNKYVRTHHNCQVEVSKSLCVMIANIICSKRSTLANLPLRRGRSDGGHGAKNHSDA